MAAGGGGGGRRWLGALLLVVSLPLLIGLTVTAEGAASGPASGRRTLGETPVPWHPGEPLGKCEEAPLQETRELRCAWAKACGEEDDSIVPYFTTYYCAAAKGGAPMAGFLVAVAMFEAATLFILLGNTADEALGPPLAQFSDELNLPPRFAGVTLLALGNGAADISATVAAVRANDWKLSLGALTGAGMFVTTCVAGLVTFLGEGTRMVGAQVRDTLALLVTTLVVGLSLFTGKITGLVASIFLIIYGSFVLIVLMSDIWHRKVTIPHRELEQMARRLAQTQLAREQSGLSTDDVESAVRVDGRRRAGSIESSLISRRNSAATELTTTSRAVDWTAKLFRKEDRYIVRHLEANARKELAQSLSHAAHRIRRKTNAMSIDDTDAISARLHSAGEARDSFSEMHPPGSGNELDSRGRAPSISRGRGKRRSNSAPGRIDLLTRRAAAAAAAAASEADADDGTDAATGSSGAPVTKTRPKLGRSKTKVLRRHSTFTAGMDGDAGSIHPIGGSAEDLTAPAARAIPTQTAHPRVGATRDRQSSGYTPPDLSFTGLAGAAGTPPTGGRQFMNFSPLGAGEQSDDDMGDADNIPLLSLGSQGDFGSSGGDGGGEEEEDDGPPLPLLGRVSFRFQKKVEWLRSEEASPMEKLTMLLDLPHKCLRRVTVPITAKDEYCRPYLVASCVGVFPWVAWNMGSNGVLPQLGAWAVGFAFAYLVAKHTRDLVPPTWGFGFNFPLGSALLALVGFVSAAAWVNLLAGELVALLALLGAIFEIQSDVMGLTVLAWGNSVGDLSANMAMAKRGLGNMAMTACFAGPVFNMMVGLGVGFTLRLSDLSAGRVPGVDPKTFEGYVPVSLPPSIAVGLTFMAFNCVAAVFIGNVVCGGTLPKNYGVASLCLYGIYLCLEIAIKMFG